MSCIDGDWFRDDWNKAGIGLSLKIEKVLHKEKTAYQEIMVLKSCTFGNVLVVDTNVQCTEADEFAYHEMIVHLTLNSHPNPKRVLVVGGGDGGVVREVLKHSCVEQVTLCEIDERVIEVCRKYLPNMVKSLDDPKTNVVIGDGLEYIKQHTDEYDVIITDVPEPTGPAEDIYEEDYYKNMKKALKPNGVLCSQGESMVMVDLPLLRKIMDFSRAIFPRVEYAFTVVPSYVGGHNGFIVCSRNPETDFKEPLNTLTKDDIRQMDLKYYNTDIHRASFCLPQYVQEALYPDSIKHIMNGIL